MGKCIKSTFNCICGEFIPKIGQFKIDVVKNDKDVRGSILVNPLSGSIALNVDISPGSTAQKTVLSGGVVEINTPNEDFSIYIGNYYDNVYRITHNGLTSNYQTVPASIDVSDLTKYASRLSLLYLHLFQDVYGKVYPNTAITELYVGTFQDPRENLFINFSEWTETTLLKTIYAYRVTNATGNIIGLAGNTSLANLNVGNTGVVGEINDFAQAMFDNGRVSGSIAITCSSSGLTLNGVDVDEVLGTSGIIDVTFSQSGYMATVR